MCACVVVESYHNVLASRVVFAISVCTFVCFPILQSGNVWTMVRNAVKAWSPFAVQFKKKYYPWVQLAGHEGLCNYRYFHFARSGGKLTGCVCVFCFMANGT